VHVRELKPWLSPSVLGALRQWRDASRHLVAWQGRRLSYTLPSGITIDVSSASDWAVYNEVFVEGEYDVPIRRVVENAADNPLIVDLGANVGYFSLRFADLWRTHRGADAPFRMISVEGCPRTFAQLRGRLRQLALDGQWVRPSFGLAGARTGEATISTSIATGLNSIHGHRSLSRARVPFIDLETIVPAEDRIALLKCDIEGAECTLLENYPGLFARVDAAVFEFHPQWCSVSRCRELLAASGLTRGTPLRTADDCGTELFLRETAASYAIGHQWERRVAARRRAAH
jgi:FkbM family methyltransferase